MVIREVADGQSGLPTPSFTRSYWHKNPSKKLYGHRTTEELPETADIVIVGSGITGAFAAHFLKHGDAADDTIVMLEAREACWGATGRVSDVHLYRKEGPVLTSLDSLEWWSLSTISLCLHAAYRCL